MSYNKQLTTVHRVLTLPEIGASTASTSLGNLK